MIPASSFKYLNSKTTNDTNIIDNPVLQPYFAMDSYTKEYSGVNGIKNHTKQVIKIFENYFLTSFELLTSITPETMITIFSLHDIGKGLNYNTDFQHGNTKSLIKKHSKDINVAKEFANFISDIVCQDAIGLYITDMCDQNQTIITLNNTYIKVKKFLPLFSKKQFSI